jgi:hypothetical protein
MGFLQKVTDFFSPKKVSRVMESRTWELLIEEDGHQKVMGEFFGTELEAFDKAQEMYVGRMFRSPELMSGKAVIGKYGIRVKP